MNLPLYDCVVYFDLRECPLVVTTMKYTENYGTDRVKDFEDERSKDNIIPVHTIHVSTTGMLGEKEPWKYCHAKGFPSSMADELHAIIYFSR